jgi:Flp pilus assembly protein TadD
MRCRLAPTAALLLLALAACEAPELEGMMTPKSVDPTLREAVGEAEQAKDYAAAADYYRNLLERKPDDQKIALALARNLRLIGQPEEAVFVLLPFIEKNDKDAKLMFELGKDQIAAAQPALAEKALKRALEFDPKNWEIHSALAVAYDYQDLSAEAQEAYLAALALSPENPTVLNNLALSQAKAGALPIAIATMERAARASRNRAQIRQNLAMLLALKGDIQGAERLTRQDLAPDVAARNLGIFRMLMPTSEK